jgi:cellulose synthase operon protein C
MTTPRIPLLRTLTLAMSLASLSPALACGPDFPMTLLDHRGLVMSALPEGTFSFEAQRLVAPGVAAFKVVESGPWSDPEESRLSAERSGLSDAQIEAVAAMRLSDSADAALALGAELPPDVARYTAGAVAWQLGDVERAHNLFEQVLQLPPEQRTLRGVWASYMLGRALALNGEPAQAIAAFEQTRTWVQNGAADPDGLAVASLGEQARIELEAGGLAAAVRLYAEQAAYGSTSGNNSLLFVVRAAIADSAAVDALLADEVGTRLLLAYLYTRYNELTDADPEEEYPSFDAPADGPRLLALLDRISSLAQVPNPDRLAAIAYRAGRFEQAAALVPKSDTPLAAWVRAKLALRAGELDAAAQAYAQAARSFPADEVWGQVPLSREEYLSEQLKPRCRVQAEAGTLALSRGDYLQALELLYAAADTYWPDTAYIAERVVTVDELRSFVDRVAADAVPPAEKGNDNEDEDYSHGSSASPAAQLRWLLARRLLREGRGAAALGYFDDPVTHGQAQRYLDALNRSSAWTRLGQARAWYEAAEIARWYGMELLGYEGDPDYFIWGGNFDLNSPVTWDEDFNPVFNPRSDIQLEGPYTSEGERQRLQASRAQPLERFHYRLTAAGLAGKAADALPPRSQAFAAVLCEATHWLIDRHNDQATAIYKRYLREGAFVPWGEEFGRQCPVPDFDKVEREQREIWMRQAARIAAISGPLVLLLALGWHLWRRRRPIAR